MIRIQAFRAIDDLASSQLFVEGHANVLKEYGVTKVTSSSNDWMHNPNVYVIIVWGADNKVVGGERIHVRAKDEAPLPIESAVGIVDKKIFNLVGEYTEHGVTAELCGLWNSKDIAGKGVSVLLTKMGVALAKLIGINYLFVLCAPYTVKMCEDCGFEIETSIGNNGTFYYPKLDLIATSLVIKDMRDLSKANIEFMNQIHNFILNPNGTTLHKTNTNEVLDITYSLTL